MKKRCLFLVVLIFIYLLLQIVIKNKSYSTMYKIINGNDTFEIIETKKNKSEYLFQVSHKDKLYIFIVDEKFKHQNNLKKIEYYSDNNMECILPIFNNDEVIYDITCNKDNELIYYHNIKDIPTTLITFKDELSKKYDINKFNDNNQNYVKDNLLMINYDNMVDNYKVAITNYRGLSIINNKIVNKNIFSTDIYNRNISLFINNYYITADYNQTYDFDKFYVINIDNNKMFEIKSDYEISFDSIIQGINSHSLYLLDTENKKQYEINIDKKRVERIGNIDKVKYFYNNKWIDLTYNEAITKEQFGLFENRNYISDSIFQDTYYDLIYTYEKEDNYYKLYLSYIDEPKIKIYLFNIYDITSVKYIDDYIYFIQDNELKYYNYKCGIKTLLKSDELIFNKNISYTVLNK